MDQQQDVIPVEDESNQEPIDEQVQIPVDDPTIPDVPVDVPPTPSDPIPIYTYTILAKEFILFSLPYLFFTFAAIYRIYKLHSIHTSLDRPSLRSQLSDEDTPKVPPPSLNIKIAISYWLCLICAISMIMGFFGLIMTISPSLFFIWLIPIIAHIMAIYLLKYEFKMQEQQAAWTHRIFWPLQTAFLVVRLIQGYQTLLNGALIVLQLAPSLILLIYALYRPNDYVRVPDDTPKFAKSLMKSLEEYQIFHSKNEIRQSYLNRSKQHKDTTAISKLISSEFSELIQSKNQNEQEQYLREKLPERNVTISKKVIKRFINDNEIQYSYLINTIIEDITFQSEKRYPDFLNIERMQIDHFNKYNASSFKIQRIDLQLGEDEYSYVMRRREYLEKWLQEQLLIPTYITKQFLDFLNIDEQMQQPFLIYQQLISKAGSTKSRVKSYQKNAEIELPALRVNSEENLVILDYTELQFSSNCIQYEYGMYGSNSIEFVINIKYKEKNQEHVYRILKTLSCIRQFSERLEQSLGRTVPPNLKITKQILGLTTNEKIIFVDEFFKELLGNQDYYSGDLFDFINFDIVKRCPKDLS